VAAVPASHRWHGWDRVSDPVVFCISQDDWPNAGLLISVPSSQPWLFPCSTRSLVELLRCVDPAAWKHFGRVTWPGAKQETHLTVRDIILIHIGHMDQHSEDIRAIREAHQK